MSRGPLSRRPCTACLLALALLAAAWGGAACAAPRVVASIGPVHALVAGVMAGVGEPALLVRAGASPHTYQMRPSDALALREARIVFWVGPALESFLRRSVEALDDDVRVVTLMDVPDLDLLRNRPPGAWTQAPAAARAGGSARTPDRDAHGHTGSGHLDAHIWLSPGNAVAMVGAIERALTDVDPDNGHRYARNADALASRLAALRVAMGAELAGVHDVPFVVFHDGFQYLERAFDLRAVGSLTLSPLGLTSARRLAALRERIAALGVRCVFREPQFEPALVSTLVEGTGAKVGVLDALGVGIEPGPDAYFELMERNARALRQCLSP